MERESARILNFLESAERSIESPTDGFAELLNVYWLGDSIALTQRTCDGVSFHEWIAGHNKGDAQNDKLKVCLRFVEIVRQAHESGRAHGDLKPGNILVSHDGEVMLVDYLDFSSDLDGERITPHYAPSVGGVKERDVFAVCKIVEEVIGAPGFTEPQSKALRAAVEMIRVSSPANATLLPLASSLQSLVHGTSAENRSRVIKLILPDGELKPFLSDEGALYLKLPKTHSSVLYIGGASEQLIINLTSDRRPIKLRREVILQKFIGGRSNRGLTIRGVEIQVGHGAVADLTELEEFIRSTEVDNLFELGSAQASTEAAESKTDVVEIGDDLESVDDDGEIVEEASKGVVATPGSLNVSELWRKSIDLEADLKIRAVAVGDSTFRRQTRRHVVSIQLEYGEFEFSSEDTVSVAKRTESGRLIQLGRLHIDSVRPEFIELDAAQTSYRDQDRIIDDGDSLEFASHFEETSRTRRRTALTRILENRAAIPDLIKFFGSPSEANVSFRTDDFKDHALQNEYKFNDSQLQAFKGLIRSRPLGLLQGPPGTGKTRFIGALVHFAISNGLARNVLLASQSHEAVNGAAEAVLSFFGNSQVPSVLRVGYEGSVSERLLPFHVARVEAQLKERFRAERAERLSSVGCGMGLPGDLCRDLVVLESVIRPVVLRLSSISEETDTFPADRERIESLKATLETLVLRLGVAADTEFLGAVDFVESIALKLAKRWGVTNLAKVDGFRSVIRLGEDFVNSVSTRKRNFEGFFAGTRQIVAGTCVGLGRSSLGLVSNYFDLVVVDEAARCASGELAVPMQAGRWVVLVGDHRQLEPMIKKPVLSELVKETALSQDDLLRSDFERVFEYSELGSCARTLTQQYRMLEPIGRLVSEAFYDGKLEHMRKEPLVPASAMPPSLESAPLVWLSTSTFGEVAYQSKPVGASTSLTNHVEAELILKLLKEWDGSEAFNAWLEVQHDFEHPIGVICTYAAQASLIRQRLRKSHLSEVVRRSIKVDTVDSYQGKENPIVVLSLVRNNASGAINGEVNLINPGFMYRANRINVAASRAMDRLVLVGSHDRWASGSAMGRLSECFARQVSEGSARIVDGVEFGVASV